MKLFIQLASYHQQYRNVSGVNLSGGSNVSVFKLRLMKI
jgi:hypothetical protein